MIRKIVLNKQLEEVVKSCDIDVEGDYEKFVVPAM